MTTPGNTISRLIEFKGMNAEITGPSRKCMVWINSTIPYGPFTGLRAARRWFFTHAGRSY